MPAIETPSISDLPSAPLERDRIVADDEVCRRTSLSRTTLWRLRKDGAFPPKVKLTRGRAGSSERAVQQWIDDRLLQRDQIVQNRGAR